MISKVSEVSKVPGVVIRLADACQILMWVHKQIHVRKDLQFLQLRRYLHIQDVLQFRSNKAKQLD